MAMTSRRTRSAELLGHTSPRIGPPTPLKSDAKGYRDFAASIGIKLYPWQELAGKYLTAKGQGDRWLYREVAIIVARQNGKTTLLVPLIMQRLLDGQSIMHTAQNAKLPREVHEMVATLLQEHYPDKLPRKRAISYAVGHEEIRLLTGGKYRIVAPTKGGARGPSNDTVIVDELREMEDHGFIGAAKPTLTASKKPQMVYLSNAGTDDSEVLNAIKGRGSSDPVLAYLEWSASPQRAADDVKGWVEANPTIGHDPTILETLQNEYRSHKLAGTLGIFETEHLCRWVATTRELLVDPHSWSLCAGEGDVTPRVPTMAVSMDPDRKRASAAIAWVDDEAVRLRLLFDVTGDPIDTDALGQDLRKVASSLGVRRVGYDPLTDRELVKYFKKAESISGGMFANATSQFANVVAAKTLRWHDADPVTDDLTWTARKLVDRDTGAFEAVRAQDDRPITASLAAIRAVYLATGLRLAAPRVM
jgi:phage terminase large subunit-like protein